MACRSAQCKMSDVIFLLKAVVNVTFGQEILFELWDWDPGFPGVQNDDPLGRCG